MTDEIKIYTECGFCFEWFWTKKENGDILCEECKKLVEY